MKAHLKGLGGRLVVEVEAANVKELFKGLAEVQEILDADQVCGACNSTAIRFNVRTVEKYTYFELKCESCHAALAFGQKQDGEGLYPKRKKDGVELANRGWGRFIPAGGAA
jgi:hypothetical protein